MKKKLSVAELSALIAGMSDAERNELGLDLKANDVKITSRKKSDKLYVAKRMNLVDSKAGARIPRVAGSIEYLTERNVSNLVNTWVRRKANESDADLELRKATTVKAIVDGTGTLELTNFNVVAIEHTNDIEALPVRFKLA